MTTAPSISTPLHRPVDRPAVPRVLIVDDEPELVRLLKDVLVAEGYEVATAGTVAAGLRALDQQDFDVLISDLRLPDDDGLALVEAAKRRRPDLMALMMTAYASLDTSVAALRNGVDDYLIKPVPIEQLLRAVHKAFERRRAAAATRCLLEDLRRANHSMRSREAHLTGEVRRVNEGLQRAAGSLRRKVEQLELVNHIAARLAGELNLDSLLELCLNLLGARLNARTGSVMLYDPQHAVLTVAAATGPLAPQLLGQRQPITEGVAGCAARERQPILVPDIERDPRFRPNHPDRYRGDRSFICVPLITRNELVGVLSIAGRAGLEPLGDDDLKLLSTVASQVAVAIRNAQFFQQQRTSSYQTVLALAEGLEAKDPYTSGHSRRVTALALKTAEALRLAEAELDVLRYAGPLHDIGKIGIEQAILNKADDLTSDEWELVRSHPTIGERIVSHLDFLSPVMPIIKHHHERWDGLGYPGGLAGEQIPLVSRILAVADAYDAITSARPYRPSRLPSEGLREIALGRATQFDPDVADAFLRTMQA
jgi:putative nucleotidyltransferase with HDIG domain